MCERIILHIVIQFAEDTVFLQLVFWPLHSKKNVCFRSAGFYLGSQFCSFGQYVYFYASNMLFLLQWFCGITWCQNCWYIQCFNHVFTVCYCLVYTGPSVFQHKFLNSLNFAKNCSTYMSQRIWRIKLIMIWKLHHYCLPFMVLTCAM